MLVHIKPAVPLFANCNEDVFSQFKQDSSAMVLEDAKSFSPRPRNVLSSGVLPSDPS